MESEIELSTSDKQMTIFICLSSTVSDKQRMESRHLLRSDGPPAGDGEWKRVGVESVTKQRLITFFPAQLQLYHDTVYFGGTNVFFYLFCFLLSSPLFLQCSSIKSLLSFFRKKRKNHGRSSPTQCSPVWLQVLTRHHRSSHHRYAARFSRSRWLWMDAMR